VSVCLSVCLSVCNVGATKSGNQQMTGSVGVLDVCTRKQTKYHMIPNSTEEDQWVTENMDFCVQWLACRAISACSEPLVSNRTNSALE